MFSVDQIISIFAPFDCLQCGREGSLLCHQCGEAIVPLPPRGCYHCRQPCVTAVCPTCRSPALRTVRVASSYQGVTSQLIARLKFARTQAAAPLIAAIMDHRLPASPVDSIVVYIPTANRRVRERGYDQARLIAQEFARRRRLRCKPLLGRHGQARQLGADRQQRQQQLRQAFYCPRPDRVRGQRIILIDDVLTTGATIEAAADVLHRAGAKDITALAFAQKI